jgi:hypothetical protein
MNIGDRVVIVNTRPWPDQAATIEAVFGSDCMARFDEKFVDGSPYDGWPWARVRQCYRGHWHFIEQILPDGMDSKLERAIVHKLSAGESVADMWPRKC